MEVVIIISVTIFLIIYVISAFQVMSIGDKKDIPINNGFIWIVIFTPIINTIYWIYMKDLSNPFSKQHFKDLFEK